MNETTITPTQASDALAYLIRARMPVFLHGAPGIGKSQIVQQTAAALGLECRDIRAALLDPVDLRGLPHVNGDGRAHWAAPDFLPTSGAGILFLDELNRAPVLVMNACFQLILDGRVGETVLPPTWARVAAGNRESDGGGVMRMPSALANRFCHLYVEPSLDDWSRWAIGGARESVPVPPEQDIPTTIHPVIVAFLRFRPALLSAFDRDAHAFPSPRSWEFVSRIVHLDPPRDLELALCAGCVGQGAAIELLAYMGLWRSLPSIDAILLNPATAPVPTELGSLYAVSAAVAHRADAHNLARVCTYLERLPKEFSVFAMKDIVMRDASLASTREFTGWAVANADVL